MLENGNLLFLYAETPFHPGASGSLGYVDLPVQRETHTGFPIYQASGLKGVMRERAEKSDNHSVEVKWVFGPEGSGSDHAGCISVGDARLLLFPVRSLKGVFAWVTCPLVLQRFARDYKSCFKKEPDLKIPSAAEGQALIDNTCTVKIDNQVVLEEYEFTAIQDAEVGRLADWLAKNALPQAQAKVFAAWRERLKGQLVIVSDDSFSAFVNFNTMVVNRTKLDNDRKVVATGALWTEEHLPPDTLMYAPVFASAPRKDKTDKKDDVPQTVSSATAVLKWLGERCGGYLVAGGDETAGRGILHAQFYGGE